MTVSRPVDNVRSGADFSPRFTYRARVRTAIPSIDAATLSTPWITPRDAAAYLGVHVETTAIEGRVGRKRKFRVRVEESVEDRLFAACELPDKPSFTRGFKLDWDKVAAIRARLANAERQLDVAKAFGIWPATP